MSSDDSSFSYDSETDSDKDIPEKLCMYGNEPEYLPNEVNDSSNEWYYVIFSKAPWIFYQDLKYIMWLSKGLNSSDVTFKKHFFAVKPRNKKEKWFWFFFVN